MAYKKYVHKFTGILFYCDKIKQELLVNPDRLDINCFEYDEEIVATFLCECKLIHNIQIGNYFK